MKRKLVAGVIGCALAVAFFYQHGFLNKLLIPGFYLSALLTVSNQGGYGKAYYALGLAINAVIFSTIIFGLFISPKPLRDQRRMVVPVTVLVLCLFAVLYALPVYGVVYARRFARNRPEMWVVPAPLPNVPLENSDGTSLSYYGYTFDVPWTQLRREEKLKSMTILSFSNDSVVLIWDPRQQVNELEVMRQGDARPSLTAKDIFGDTVTKSRYAFHSSILYMTPDDLRLSWSRPEMAANSALILMKPMFMGLTKSCVYSFHTEWLDGFQAGDPRVDKATEIVGFDAQDREIKLSVASKEGTRKPSQAEMDRIIYSLHPL